MRETTSRVESSHPWIVYHYGLTHDQWWPVWSSTRVTGRAKIGMGCAVCGRYEIARIRIPRFGKINQPGRHPVREAFVAAHAHPDRGHPMSWAKPLLSMNALDAHGGLDVDMLAMRLEADLNQETS